MDHSDLNVTLTRGRSFLALSNAARAQVDEEEATASSPVNASRNAKLWDLMGKTVDLIINLCDSAFI
jgi:hypothetical protein